MENKTIIVESFKGINNTFKDLSWVLKAVSKDITKTNLNGVMVTNSEMVATDGHRLHKAELSPDGTELPEGFYQVLKASKDQIILQQVEEEFPNYKQAIPDGEPVRSRQLVCEMPRKGKTDHSRTYTESVRYLNHRYSLNFGYYNDAVDGEENWKFEVYESGHPVVFRNFNKLAIIMPLEVKD